MSTNNSNSQLLMPNTKGKNENKNLKKSTLLTRGSIVIKCIITGTYTLVYTSLNINNDNKRHFRYLDASPIRTIWLGNMSVRITEVPLYLWPFVNWEDELLINLINFLFFLKMPKDQGWFNSVWGEALEYFLKRWGWVCVSILWGYVNKEVRQVWKTPLPISWRDIIYLQNLTSWVESLRSGI